MSLFPDLATTPGIQWPSTPSWLDTGYSIHMNNPGLRHKVPLRDRVIFCLVETHLEEAYGGFQRVFTGGSVGRGSRSAIAAFAVPTTGHTWRARLNSSASSTTSEYVVITGAMAFLTKALATQSIILCDSCWAF